MFLKYHTKYTSIIQHLFLNNKTYNNIKINKDKTYKTNKQHNIYKGLKYKVNHKVI